MRRLRDVPEFLTLLEARLPPREECHHALYVGGGATPELLLYLVLPQRAFTITFEESDLQRSMEDVLGDIETFVRNSLTAVAPLTERPVRLSRST